MIFFDKTRTIGQDANGKNVVWVSIYVDSAANLPAYNAYQTDGFILCMASEGRCIDTGDLYRLDSSGVWQISQSGTGTYTKAEIDALLNAKQDVLAFDATPTQNSTNPVTSGGMWTDQQRQDALQTEDRAALIEIVDGGAKNVRNITLDELKTLGGNSEFTWSGNVATKSNVSFTINADETITVNAAQSASAQVILDIYRMPSDASDMVLSGAPAGGDADSYFQYVKGTTFRDYGDGVLYSRTGAHSIGLVIAQGYRPQNLTFEPMICTLADWKISQTFQPYRPSYQELYEMVLALQ